MKTHIILPLLTLLFLFSGAAFSQNVEPLPGAVTVSNSPLRFGICVPAGSESHEMAIDYIYDGDTIQDRDIFPATVTNGIAIAELRTRMCAPYYIRSREIIAGVLTAWTTDGILYESTPDLNGDGVVSVDDFSELASFWGITYDGSDFGCLVEVWSQSLDETCIRSNLTCTTIP